jgi:prepilin-type processing-associated H-X9-DG protein
VAASIFIAGVLTLMPAIQRSRERMNQAGCVFNLQQLGSSLAQYASLQPFLPHPPAQRSDTHAGMFAVMLHDAGVLPDPSILDCPCNGPCPHVRKELASFETIDQIRRTDPERYERMLCWDYAYNVGYRLASGHLQPLDVTHSSRIPVLADQPDHRDFLMIRDGNSLNHGRRGQNVLFGDGSVRWYHSRMIGPHDPDLFLNNEQQPRPGVHPSDSVLVPSKVPFEGR